MLGNDIDQSINSTGIGPLRPLVQTLGRGPTVGSPWSSSTLLSLRRGQVAPIQRWSRSRIRSGADLEFSYIFQIRI